MTLVNLDNDVYEQAKEFVNKDRVRYPTVKNFVDRVVLQKLQEEKEILIED